MSSKKSAHQKPARQSINLQVGSAAQHIDAYFEYRTIVGDADGGVLFTEKQFEEFKKKVQSAPRLFVSWRPTESDMECRLIGPESKCFCNHRFKSHKNLKNSSKGPPCLAPDCKCSCFSYIPARGIQDIKCHCKHSFKEHSVQDRSCGRVKCQCSKFSSSYHCSCGRTYNEHETVFQTSDERQKEGRPVGFLNNGNPQCSAAFGGITSFMSLLDGVDREP